MVSKRRTGTTEVHTITSAPEPLADDIDRRARRYLLQMGLRTFCFLAAVFTWGRIPTWISVALLIGAVVLPYIAVVLANAGRERPRRPEDFVLDDELRRLTATASTPPVSDGRVWESAPIDGQTRDGAGRDGHVS